MAESVRLRLRQQLAEQVEPAELAEQAEQAEQAQEAADRHRGRLTIHLPELDVDDDDDDLEEDVWLSPREQLGAMAERAVIVKAEAQQAVRVAQYQLDEAVAMDAACRAAITGWDKAIASLAHKDAEMPR